MFRRLLALIATMALAAVFVTAGAAHARDQTDPDPTVTTTVDDATTTTTSLEPTDTTAEPAAEPDEAAGAEGAFTVTNGNDSGAGSYRQAIADASSDGSADVITFDAGLTVTLASSVDYTGTTALTLNGNGSTIDGVGAHQILFAGAATTITVDDLTLTNSLGLNGGAIDTDADVVITNSTLTDNTADSGPGGTKGGAVFSNGGTVTVTDSTLTGNTVTDPTDAKGGAVNATGDVDITNSTLSTNTATATSTVGGSPEAHGGAVFSETGAITITAGSILNGNSATTGGCCGGEVAIGGAVATGSGGGKVTITDSTLNTNSVGPTRAYGGAASGDRIEVLRSTLNGNSSTLAGGALVGGPSGVTVTDSTMDANTAIVGGAIHLEGGGDGTVTVDNSMLTNNTVTGDASQGGAVNATHVNVTNNSTLTGNTVTSSDFAYGGAVAAQGNATITDSTVSTNSVHGVDSGDGGAVSAGYVTVTNSTLDGNTATATAGQARGGAVSGGGPPVSVTVTASTLTGNTATGTDSVSGGAVFAHQQVDIAGSTLAGNTAESTAHGNGGAISADGVSLAGSTVAGNTAVLSPDAAAAAPAVGGVAAGNGGISAVNSTITGNTVTNTGVDGFDIGGLGTYGDVSLAHVTVASNSAPGTQVAGGTDLTTFGTVFTDPLGGSSNCTFFSGTTISNGYNYSTDGSCGLTGTGDTENGADPLLGALADNGGPTETLLPAWGSPLVDAVPNADCDPAITDDQRGEPRPNLAGGACDIGAVELGPALTVTKAADQTSVTAGAQIDYHLAIENTGEVDLSGVVVTDPDAPACDGPVPDIAVGDTETVDCSYTTNDPGDVGTYSNTASVVTDQVPGPTMSNQVNVTVTPTCTDHGLSDVPAWIDPATTWAVCNMYMTGYPNDTFRPNLDITRGQAARVAFRIAGSPGGSPANTFPDVPDWLDAAVDWMSANGYMTGYPDGNFKPNDPITRGQESRMLFRVAGSPGGSPANTFPDVPNWLDAAVDWHQANSYMDGYPNGTFRDTLNITRGQVVNVEYNINK